MNFPVQDRGYLIGTIQLLNCALEILISKARTEKAFSPLLFIYLFFFFMCQLTLAEKHIEIVIIGRPHLVDL